MENLGEKIKQIRKELGLSQKDFGEKIDDRKHYPSGICAEIVSAWELNKSRPRIETLVKIASLGRIKLEWLISEKKEKTLMVREAPAEYGEEVRIPILARVPAGNPSNAPQEVIGYTYIPKVLYDRRKGNLFSVRVTGNCMYPILSDGDEVIFDIGLLPENRDIVVARIGEDKYEVRRFYRSKDKIELRPEDTTGYKSIEITKKMGVEVTIIGVVIRQCRNFRR